MKRITLLLLALTSLVIFQSATKKVDSSGNPPTGLTGATGNYCTGCHNDFSLNSGGGSVSTSGLPAGSYIAGQQYNFSLSINHGSANRRRWGFSIKAVNAAGQNVGTFSSTNANATSIGSGELGHNNAVSTANAASYTYNNLRWTAPTSPSVSDRNITFYFVGNAADGGGSSGDFIYSNSSSTVLPALLSNLKATINDKIVHINWQATQQVNVAYYEIEKSSDAQLYYSTGKVIATSQENYSFSDKNPSYFNKPIYYRIKVVDNDGSFKYSTVLTVTLKADKIFVIKTYPTAVAKGTTVTTDLYSDKATKLTMQLIDVSGRVVMQNNYQLSVGANKLTFQVQNPSNSQWLFAKFIADDFAQTIPLITQ